MAAADLEKALGTFVLIGSDKLTNLTLFSSASSLKFRTIFLLSLTFSPLHYILCLYSELTYWN